MVKQVESVVPAIDRISDLPDHIKHDILSRLDTRDAVRTSVLSRRWRHEWNWLPCLSFDKHLLPFDSLQELLRIAFLGQKREQEIIGKKEAFLNFMDQALLRRSTKGSSYILQKLSLYAPFSHVNIASHVDLWLACALKCGVRKLHLFVSFDKDNYIYQLPERFLQHASFMTWLKLSQCKIISKNPGLIRMYNLQVLSLDTVYVDERTLTSMITNCGMIKKLRIITCAGFDKLEVSGVPKLEKVKIVMHELERVVIDAVNLQTFSFRRGDPPGKVNVATCKNIRHLKLDGIAITDDQLSFHVSKLHFLEDLCLISCDSLRSVRIYAPNLKHLNVDSCDKLHKAEIDVPKLESFTFWTNMISLSLTAPCLASVFVSLRCLYDDVWWYVMFIKFLTNFDCSTTTLSLSHIPNMHLYIRKEIRRMFLSPLWNVKHVVVQMGLPVERCTHSLAEIIDSLLWLSPHPDSISLLIYSEVIIKFQFVYKEPADSVGEADSCCCSVPIKCWRHSLTEVKIDNLPCVEGARRLKALFEESQTLERIEGLL